LAHHDQGLGFITHAPEATKEEALLHCPVLKKKVDTTFLQQHLASLLHPTISYTPHKLKLKWLQTNCHSKETCFNPTTHLAQTGMAILKLTCNYFNHRGIRNQSPWAVK
jgi:hypothetical protein